MTGVEAEDTPRWISTISYLMVGGETLKTAASSALSKELSDGGSGGEPLED